MRAASRRRAREILGDGAIDQEFGSAHLPGVAIAQRAFGAAVRIGHCHHRADGGEGHAHHHRQLNAEVPTQPQALDEGDDAAAKQVG